MKSLVYIKRIIFVCVFVIFSLSIYGIVGILEQYKNNKSVQTNALPITNKVVVIDAGHGGIDQGAVGFNGTSEQAINLSISLKLQKLIEQSGAKVLLTRSDENGIYSLDSNSIKQKKVSDIKNRVEIGQNSNADIFVSIHLNKYPPSEIYRGWQTFFQKNNANSKILAELIQDALNKNIEFKNDRASLALSNVYIMDKVSVPTVTVECGFLSNPQEAELLKTDNYQNKIAWGIYNGIQQYFANLGEVD